MKLYSPKTGDETLVNAEQYGEMIKAGWLKKKPHIEPEPDPRDEEVDAMKDKIQSIEDGAKKLVEMAEAEAEAAHKKAADLEKDLEAAGEEIDAMKDKIAKLVGKVSAKSKTAVKINKKK